LLVLFWPLMPLKAFWSKSKRKIKERILKNDY